MGANVNIWHVMSSMRSVNKWQDTINSNINGALRVGFRESDVMFGGGRDAYIKVAPRSDSAGTQIGEQTISISHSFLNWKQGEVIRTGNDLDFAIQGSGMFMVSKNPTNPTPSEILYTRDGQFHIEGGTGRLATNDGYYVLGNSNVFGGLSAVTVPAGSDPFTDIVSNNKIRFAMFSTLDQLQYSKELGATYFENPTGQLDPTVSLPDDTANASGRLATRSLEGANVNINKQIASLSYSKQLFESLTKQLTVYFANFDVGLNLIK